MVEIESATANHQASSPCVETNQQTAVVADRRIKKLIFLLLGFACLGLAYLGWLLPGLPCTPFVILASLCFGKSSARLQRWLLGNRLFGPILRDFHDHRGIQRKYKIRSTVLVVIVVTGSVLFLIYSGRPWYLWSILPPLAILGLLVIWLGVRTLSRDECDTANGGSANR